MTPKKFETEVWHKMSLFKDGLTKRFLIIFAENDKTSTSAEEEANIFIDNNSNIKELNYEYKKIIAEHKDVKVYNLSLKAKNILTNYLENNEGLTKLEKNTLNIKSACPLPQGVGINNIGE